MVLSARKTLITIYTRSSCRSIWWCSPDDPSSGQNCWKEKARCKRTSDVSQNLPANVSKWPWINSPPSPSVKRYVRKGIPNEHRPLIWMAASGAEDQLDKNPGYYQSLLRAHHDSKLVETICTGHHWCSKPALKNPMGLLLNDLCDDSFRPQQNISGQHQFPQDIQPMSAEGSL